MLKSWLFYDIYKYSVLKIRDLRHVRKLRMMILKSKAKDESISNFLIDIEALRSAAIRAQMTIIDVKYAGGFQAEIEDYLMRVYRMIFRSADVINFSAYRTFMKDDVEIYNYRMDVAKEAIYELATYSNKIQDHAHFSLFIQQNVPLTIMRTLFDNFVKDGNIADVVKKDKTSWANWNYEFFLIALVAEKYVIIEDDFCCITESGRAYLQENMARFSNPWRRAWDLMANGSISFSKGVIFWFVSLVATAWFTVWLDLPN